MERENRVFALVLLASAALLGTGRVFAADAPDLELLRQKNELKRETQAKIQSDILDPVLGRDKAKVFVDVDLEVMTQRRENTRQGAGMAEKNKEKGGGQGAFQTQFILPGVPKPKNVTGQGAERPASAQSQFASQQKGIQEEIWGVKPIFKKFDVTVVHDDTVPKAKLKVAREGIDQALAPYKGPALRIIFKPMRFNAAPWMDDLKNPAVYVPLTFATLLLLLLLWLFGPFARFLRRYVDAIREKPAAEVNVESTIEPPEPEKDPLGPDKSELDIMLGRKPPEPPPEPEEDEEMKKFEPFTYINEENLKRLANLFLLRRDEPWLIAVVMSYLKPEFARQILMGLPVELQAKVALEALKVRQVTREQVVAIDADIKESVDFVVGGMERLTQMLEEADTQTRQNILEYLKNEKPMIYERVRKFVLTFEDVVGFPDREMQTVVRDLKTEAMARALQGASPDVVDKFVNNMSSGAASLLKESMEYAKGATPAQIEEERAKIMDHVKAMEKEGKVAVREGRGSASEGFQEELATERTDRLGGARSSAPAGNRAEGAAEGAAAWSAGADPAQARQSFDAGVESHDSGRYEECLQHFRQAIDLDPGLWQAYQYIGGALVQLGRYPEALIYYEKLLEYNPDPQLRAWVDSYKAQAGATRG